MQPTFADDPMTHEHAAPPAAPSEGAEPSPQGRWRALADAAAGEFRERLGLARGGMSDRDRDRITERLRGVMDAALEVSPEQIARAAERAARIRAAAPADTDPVRLAWQRTRERARRTAAVGAVTTLPAMIPGIGTAVAAVGLVADWRYVAEQQRDLVLEIAALLGTPMHEPTDEVRALFLAGAGTAFGGGAAGEAAAAVLGRQLARRSVAKVLPGAGAVISGALNYVATLAIGRAAIQGFAREAGLVVRGVIPERMHPAMPRLRQSVVSAVRNAPLGDGALPVFTREQREILLNLSTEERAELLDRAGLAALPDALGDEERRVLGALSGELGFGHDELKQSVSAAERDAERYTRRVGKRLRGAWSRAVNRVRPASSDEAVAELPASEP